MKMGRGWIVLAGLAWFCGCAQQDRPPGMPDLFPCTLTFTQNGQPLVEATIEVVGVDSTEWSAGGLTDQAGRVELVTYGQFPGVREGRHKVVVNKRESEASEAVEEMEGGIVLSGGGSSLPTEYTLVDQQYTSAASTPLTIEITSGGEHEETFELGAPVRERL